MILEDQMPETQRFTIKGSGSCTPPPPQEPKNETPEPKGDQK